MSSNPSDHDEQYLHRKARFDRIRRLKRWLRPLPRRSNVHRYPFLKYFSDWARKRAYLWSIRPAQMVPAIYAGSVITILPLQGVQIPLSFLAAILFKANLPVIVALQFLSNAFTLPFIYALDYYIGDYLLSFFAKKNIINVDMQHLAVGFEQVVQPTEVPVAGNWFMDIIHNCFEILIAKGPYFFGAAVIGGLILGFIGGLILHLGYVWLWNKKHF